MFCDVPPPMIAPPTVPLSPPPDRTIELAWMVCDPESPVEISALLRRPTWSLLQAPPEAPPVKEMEG